MGKGNFLPGQYESVYTFTLSDLTKKYFGVNDDDIDNENYNENFFNIIDDLKQGIQNSTVLGYHFTTTIKKENRHFTKRYYDFLVIAESDFYKIVVNDESDFMIALVIDDNAYNYDLSESDIEYLNRLKYGYDIIDKALKKVLLGFAIDLYKPCGAWTSGKVMNDDKDKTCDCPYCGSKSDSVDSRVLCQDCRETFGHTFIEEL